MSKLLAYNPARKTGYNKNRASVKEEACVLCNPEITGKCSIISGEYWSVFANHYPFIDYAVLMVPKRHFEYVQETKDKEWHELNRIMERLASAWDRYYRNEYVQTDKERMLDEGEPSFNFYINNGEHSGQTQRHLHWHFIPRVYRRYTGMEMCEGFHKVKMTPEETAELFKRLLKL